jgi:NAD(P)-dependent dehydrogenase (short-subunit alcohol dehydrogenase family)
MVALDLVRASNASIPKQLPPRLVAIFVGGTSGIGEATLKLLAKLATKPKIYLVGRSSEAAARIIAECRTLNPEGQYVFIQADLTLLRSAQELCDDIKSREDHVNLLFLSVGLPDTSLESKSCQHVMS